MKKTIILSTILLVFGGCIKDTIRFELGVFTIYPNPILDYCGIIISNQIPQNTIYDLNVSDGKDRKVFEILNTNKREYQLNITNEPKGIYYVNMIVDGTTFTQVVLKAK